MLLRVAGFGLVVFLMHTTGATQTQVFRAGVDTMSVYAQVRNDAGRFVTDLPRDAFEILDAGTPSAVTIFAHESRPVTVAAMFDMSDSMAAQYLWVRSVAEGFVAALSEDDHASIGSFGVEVALSPRFTSNRHILDRFVRDELWPGGATLALEAIDAGLVRLKREPGHRFLLVVSDANRQPTGVDIGKVARVQRQAADAGIGIYGVGRRDGGLQQGLRDLGTSSGGGYALLAPDVAPAAEMRQVLLEMKHRYLIGFRPATLDGKRHRLSIRVRVPGLTVLAPTSYVPGRQDPGR